MRTVRVLRPDEGEEHQVAGDVHGFVVLRDEPMKAVVVEPGHDDLVLLDFGADFLDDGLVVDALLPHGSWRCLAGPGLGLVRDGDAGQQAADLLVELSSRM
jgi:hypothetical protein